MGRTVVVRYTTSQETAEENARLVADVFAALGRAEPAGFRYTTVRFADGVTFVHTAHFDGPDNPLAALPEFAEFQRDLAQRCVTSPEANDATVVGSYG